MACFFGAVPGSAAPRRTGAGGGAGQESPGSVGCAPMVPSNSWVCAVLPVDSCSEGEDAAEEEAGSNLEAPDVSSTSTCTPPTQAIGSSGSHSPEADVEDPMGASSLSPSDSRSERSRAM